MNIVGYWQKTVSPPLFSPDQFPGAISLREPIHIVFEPRNRLIGIASEGVVSSNPPDSGVSFPLLGSIPAIYPEWLGDRSFQETHGTRFSYVGGAMARGISSSEMVIELARCGMLGFFGSAGLPPDRVEKEIVRIKSALEPSGLPWGVNLIHSPGDPGLEQKLVDMYLDLGVERVSAAAFMGISPALVRYSCKGLSADGQGGIRRENHIFAKISRPEVAAHFLNPPPDKILTQLFEEGRITKDEADLARHLPLAEDFTIEGDSGGHTDNRPLAALFSRIADLKSETVAARGYQRPIRLGAAGGIGSPAGLAAAFALGASYAVLGSVHQACAESGASREVKELLAQADIADVTMCPSADMFELGGKVQVLKKGTMLGGRANRLLQIYNRYDSIDEIPDDALASLEKTIFQASVKDIWEGTKDFFAKIDPAQIEKAQNDPKHKMALIFRWYLGNSSKWAIDGTKERRLDYQVWCGPAIGAFNSWVKGSFLEKAADRKAGQVALNLLEGAAFITKLRQLSTYGVPVPAEMFSWRPVKLVP